MLIKWYDFKYVYLYGNENQIFRVRNVYRLVCSMLNIIIKEVIVFIYYYSYVRCVRNGNSSTLTETTSPPPLLSSSSSSRRCGNRVQKNTKKMCAVQSNQDFLAPWQFQWKEITCAISVLASIKYHFSLDQLVETNNFLLHKIYWTGLLVLWASSYVTNGFF